MAGEPLGGRGGAGGQRPGRGLAQLEGGRAPRGDGGLGRRVVVGVRREPRPEPALVEDAGDHGKRVRQPARDPGQLALEPVVVGRAQVDLGVELLELLVPAGPVPPLQVVPEPLHLRVPGGAQRGEHDPGLAGVARTRVDQPCGRLGRLAVRTGPDREPLVHHAGGEVHVGPVDRGAGRGQRTGPVALLLAGLGDQRPDPGAQRGVVEQRLHERQRSRRVVLGTQHPSRLGDPGPPDEVLPRLGTPGGRQRDGRPGRAAAYGGLRSALDAHQTSTCCRGSP